VLPYQIEAGYDNVIAEDNEIVPCGLRLKLFPEGNPGILSEMVLN